jgi:hypothetical protein
MLKLRLHQKFHIPNSLAVFAALLLLVSSIVGFESSPEIYSSAQEFKPTVESEAAETGRAKDVVEHKSRRLNLGLLLFRRG